MSDEQLKIIAGSGGGGKSGGSQRSMVEDPDSLQSQAMISLLDMLGEGEIGGLVGGATNGAKSIFLDETPLQNSDGTFNFKDVTWAYRTGTQGQAPIPGFSSVESPFAVGLQVKKLMPQTVTINNPNADSVRVIVSIPALMSQDTSNGDIHGTTVQYTIQVSKNGGAYSDAAVATVTGKTRSKYQRSHLITLPKPATTWNVRMVRVTADSASSALSNDTYFDSYAEIIESKLSYPNSALVGTRLDSKQFSRVPARSYLVDGIYIQVPQNYDPVTRAYSGTWNGTFKLATSNNPAWILYDLLTNPRYGLGQHITAAQVDKATLYQVGRYCDELVPDGFGGLEPRFTVNTVIQTRAEAYKVVSDLTSAFRGMAFWAGGLVGFTQDAPRDPSMIFSAANVVDGVFTYSGSARKDRNSVALITWNDPLENYKQKIEYVEVPDLVQKFGIRQTEMVAFGCASRGQAHRAGLALLYTGQYETDLITFKVGIDAALVLPGEVIKIHDALRAGKRMGGRLVSCTNTSAVLDAPITLASGGATFSVRLPDGTFVDCSLLQPPGTFTTVSWVTPLSALPLPNSMWMVSEENLKPLLARVIAVTPSNSTEFTITALEHNPSKYGAIELGLKLETPKTSIIDINKVETPTNFIATESQYLVAPSILGAKIHLSWSGTAPLYELRWRRTGTHTTNWTTVSTRTPAYEIENAQKGTHEFELVSVNMAERHSSSAVLTYSVKGKTASPGEVANFTVSKRVTDLLLSWSAVTDVDLVGYEVREGASWGSSRLIQSRFMGTSCVDDQSEPGTYSYFIRSIDTSGNYSDNVTTFVLVLDAPAPVQNFDCVQSDARIEFRWKANTEVDIVAYEIREGASWASGTRVTQIMGTSYTMPAGSIAGERMFWIKAIAAPGIEATTGVFSIGNIAPPTDRNVVVQIDERAGGWTGSKFNVTPLAGDLVLDSGKSYGEYTFGVTLPISYRARNSIISTFDAIYQDGAQWVTTSYQWRDPQAGRPWVLSGDLGSVDLDYYISKFVGLDASYVEGFALSGSTAGEKGTVAAQAVGVTYGAGRFLQGAKISDFVRLNWNVSVPTSFNVTFWVIPQDFSGNRVLWSAVTATGLQLICGADEANGCIYLEDTCGGARLTVPIWPASNDRMLIGIVQTGSTRRLHVGLVNQTPQSASASVASIGALTNMRLHQ